MLLLTRSYFCFLGNTEGAEKYEYLLSISVVGDHAVNSRTTFSNMSLVWADLHNEYLNSFKINDSITKNLGKLDSDCENLIERKGNIFLELAEGGPYLTNIPIKAKEQGKKTFDYLDSFKRSASDTIQKSDSEKESDLLLILLSGDYNNKQYTANAKLENAKSLFNQQLYPSAKKAAEESSTLFFELKNSSIDPFEAVFRIGVMIFVCLLLVWCIVKITMR